MPGKGHEEELRKRAERALGDADRYGIADPERLLHELEVHQIELEVQNEELREAQLALTESRDRYYELYDLAPVGYLTLDSSGRIEEANLAMAQLLEVTRAELIGRRLGSYVTASHARAMNLHFNEAFANGVKTGCDLVLMGADGREISAHLDSIAIADDSEKRTRCRTVVIDLSELHAAQKSQRASEKELRETEARFEQIAEHIDDVFLLHDRAQERVIYASPAFEKVWGRPAAEVCRPGTPWIDWVHSDDRDRIVRAYQRIFEGQSFSEEYRICRPDGEVRWVRGRTYPITGADGRVQRDASVVQDITSERALQEELRQAQKMEALGALASGVAHDFNNVLQVIVGCLQIARASQTPTERAERLIDRAVSAARDGGALAGQLMEFSRKQTPAPQPLAIDAVLAKAAPLLERLLTEGIHLEMELDAAGRRIVADPVQIEQILMNLAANARDAMPEGGTLSIRSEVPPARLGGSPRLEGKGDYVRILVEDTGTGMDERTRARVFEPFFTTKEVGKGTGLGLSTVFAVTRRLGGHIAVESEVGRGTAFSLYLPISKKEAAGSRRPSTKPPVLTGTALLVEDQPLVRMTVRHYLLQMGLEVLEAADAGDALEICDSHSGPIDLLVSDVVLPVTSGPRLAALLRQRYPELRVLLMSANAELLAQEAASGVPSVVLGKPFTKDELAVKLEELMA